MNKINFFILSLMVLINVLLFSQDYEYEIFKLIDNNSISEIKNKVLNKEININFKNKYEETPLLYAIKTNASNEIIKYLINSGADINVTTNEINIDFYSYKKGIDNKTLY